MTQPFKVSIDQSRLTDLKKRIKNTRWTDALTGSDWKSGISLSYLKDLAGYWATEFDWRKVERAINGYPNFISEIDGYKIHYLHVTGKGKNTIPLIITHGWPGSFLEMMKIIPLLTADEEFSFDLVIPSLPGYGFSEKIEKEGIDTNLMAGLWVKLMEQLGYKKFMAQGGDFGAFVSTYIAWKYPDRFRGLHLNYIPFSYRPYLQPGEKLTEEEIAAQQKTNAFFQKEGAYAQVHVSKPLTISYALNDSPVGLCAWILQIFHSFSDPDRHLEDLFIRDELLANVTLYWLTETIHSSIRLYGESVKSPLQFGKDDFVNVPVGIAHYPYPDSFPARKFVERGYHVTYWKDLPKGGHFAALEQPMLFADDIKEFAKSVASVASGVVT